MAVTTEIPWGDGSGDKIYLTRNASEGDQVVQVSSDANSGNARSKVVTFTSGVGNIVRQLTINQAAGVSLEYVQDGLLYWWDGIDKGGTTEWVDKINGHAFTNNGAVFNSDHVYLNGNAFLVCSTIPSFPSTRYGTIEVVYENEGGYGVIIMPPSATVTDGQVGFGIIPGYGLMWSVFANRPKYSDAPIKGSVSISLARALGNGVSLTRNGSSYLSNGGSKPAYIGKRDYGAINRFTGKIYCIRIYSRQLTQDEVFNNLALDNTRFNLGLQL